RSGDMTNKETTGLLPVKPVLTLQAAQRIIARAEEEAARHDLRLSIAVVDDAGLLVGFARMDGVHSATIDVAIAKARTAALFRKPTEAFAEALAGGATGIAALPNMLPFPGGVPLLADGAVV